jgi:hypothetical protein
MPKLINLFGKGKSDQWKEYNILPFYKNGVKTDCNNYCGISLLSSSKCYLVFSSQVKPIDR